uniref:Uncharacterized protein n=1 Tax=Leptobrachium leishanense TaxID=445787 RepID=A0A8C5PVT5_9ANUR
MASADLRDELTCSICLNIYTYPVTLPCGHSFCRTCIGDVLDTQERSGAYKCPECRAESQERPALVKNRKLRKVAERFRSITHPEQEEAGIPCTYCDSPVPAAKTCLHCEASLCEKNLKKHSKSAEHVLTEPTTSLENRKCSVHKEILRHYCCEDAVCICVYCKAGEHRGHQVETLNEASEKKKEKLRNILQKLTSQREEAEIRVQSLEEHRRQVQEKAVWVTERVTALIRKQLELLEKRVLSEISRQEEQVSLRVLDLLRQLEIKKEELSRKMGDIKELCDMTDPVTVLQGRESDRDDYCDTEEDTERRDIKAYDVEDLDVGLISVTLCLGLAGIVRRCHVPEASDMLLDVNTACYDVSVSEDLKTVSRSGINQRRPETPERFQDYQVLSSRSFSSGRHYWEVEGSESGGWKVGMTYPSIKRRGEQSWIGNNNKSWCLEKSWLNNQYYMRHDSFEIHLPLPPSCCRFGIFLDYKAGRLSFYELCDPIRHIHTFTAAFTEPLHAVFGLFWDNSWVRICGIS